jgi:hypothetical protein
MSSTAHPVTGSRPSEVRVATWLAAIAAWTIAVPYIADPLGLTVPVRGIVEVVDHVIPGVLTVAAALYLRALAQRGPLAGQRLSLPVAGLAFLAGFWVLATHLPLVLDAARTDQPWDAAIFHSITGLPVAALAAWCVLRSAPEA